MHKWITLVLSLLMPAAMPAQETKLRAGIAKVDLTPSAMMPMYGYANRRCGPQATGTHDPLFAKALVLDSGNAKLAIVTLDLGSIVSENLPKQIAAKLGIPVTLLAASHTHSGPAFLPPAPAPQYQAEIEDKIFDAVKRAAESTFAARLGVGRGAMQLGYNRLLKRDDGRSRALFDNLERIPHGPVDPEYVLLRVDDASGTPKAVVIHYATHAVVLGPSNCKYSADFPGVLQARVESGFAGAQAMFVQGGAGDINPLFMARTGKEEEDFTIVRKMGETLAEPVIATARAIDTKAEPNPSITYKSEVMTFADRWQKDRNVEVGITTVLLNRDIAIAATAGELMHKLQLMWKQNADVPHALFYGYTYSSGGVWPGYIPDLRTAAYGGYGADVTTRIEIGAGETIIQRHLKNLFGLRGMWRDQPGRP